MELTYWHEPPNEKRRSLCEGGRELKFSEGAVQLAFALHLLSRSSVGARVEVYPDGEHAKYFDIPALLAHRGFLKTASLGSTDYGGVYSDGSMELVVNPKSQHGRGDVVGEIDGKTVRAECKGGIVNSRHSGARSKMRSGFNELIGQTMSMEVDGARHVAVLPKTADTQLQAKRLFDRCSAAGIEIALISVDGSVEFVTSG